MIIVLEGSGDTLETPWRKFKDHSGNQLKHDQVSLLKKGLDHGGVWAEVWK